MITKKFIITFSLFLFSFASAEHNVSDNNISADTLTPKITLLYVESDHCKYCQELDQLMHQGEPAQLIDAYFVIKKVNLNELVLPEGLPMPFGAPTVYFLDANNQALIEPIQGMQSEENLMLFLEDAIVENSHQPDDILYSRLDL